MKRSNVLIGAQHPIKSLFGSHSSMRCDDVLEDTLLGAERVCSGEILLRDQNGYYTTKLSRLDNGLADFNRLANRI